MAIIACLLTYNIRSNSFLCLKYCIVEHVIIYAVNCNIINIRSRGSRSVVHLYLNYTSIRRTLEKVFSLTTQLSVYIYIISLGAKIKYSTQTYPYSKVVIRCNDCACALSHSYSKSGCCSLKQKRSAAFGRIIYLHNSYRTAI